MAEDGPAGQEQTPRAAGETTMIHRVETTIGGRTLSLETGRLAEQAGGAVLARYGETLLLAAATTSAAPREGIDFFPLTVDVEERLYAAGKIPGGFIKREGRPTEHSILASRIAPSARSSPRATATTSRSSSPCSRWTRRTTPTSSASSPHPPRSASQTSPSPDPSAASPSATLTARSSSTRSFHR